MSAQAHNNTLGIDFGTSNSAAGIMVGGKPHLIALEPGQTTIPTSVFFDFETHKTLYGNPANMALIEGSEGRFMRALKSVLGTSLMHEKRRMMGQTLSFSDIISQFLTEIKTRAEIASDRPFDTALSGRPVHFHSGNATKDAQALTDLTDCYHKAGFQHVRFMYEPEAAALANQRLNDDGNIGLIVDIGGGTSDFCLFENRISGINILASHGVRVGGTNFDKSISVDHVMPLFGKGSEIRTEMGDGTLTAPNALFQDLATWEKIPFLYTAGTRQMVAGMHRQAVDKPLFARLNTVLEHQMAHEMAFSVERGKIQINNKLHDSSKVDLEFIEPDLSVILTQENMTYSLSGHAQKIQECALETLAMAGLTAALVDTVIFVGGSSLMSVVEAAMADLFPSARLQHADAFTAIVDGLAISSALD
jgi:hypothetical chaperone protein